MSKYQEALEFFRKLPHRIPLKFANDEFCKEYDKSFVSIKELVDKATWIPVEKKLPPMFTEVMITYEDNDFIPRRSLAYINESHEWIYPLMNNYKYRVIAWMPLPEPYLGSVR